MSKMRLVIVLFALAFLFSLPLISDATDGRDSQPVAIAHQQIRGDFCCAARMSCCTIPPRSR
jgi:hypothetical protein